VLKRDVKLQLIYISVRNCFRAKTFAVIGMLCRLQRYHLVDIVDEVLAHTEHGNTVGHRSGIAVDDSALFENTTLPAIDMDLSSDPDIVNVWRKSYSMEDMKSVVDETDSDSSDTVSSDVIPSL